MSDAKKCVFCDEMAEYSNRDKDFAHIVKCPNCGTYIIDQFTLDLDIEQYKHFISGFIREKNDLRLTLEVIRKGNIQSILGDPLIPKTIMQKLDKILLYLYRATQSFGTNIFDEYKCYSRGYAKNLDEYITMLHTLVELEFLAGNFINSDTRNFRGNLTFKGMTRAEELTSTNIYSNKVFVAMGFKPDLIEAHEKAIQYACDTCGFKANLISETEHNDDINDRIIAAIKTSKFIIADFTYSNQGAYFEAGYAQGRGLPVIRTCRKDWFDGVDEKGEKNHLHFDVEHYNIILWKDFDDLKEKLINRIRATIL